MEIVRIKIAPWLICDQICNQIYDPSETSEPGLRFSTITVILDVAQYRIWGCCSADRVAQPSRLQTQHKQNACVTLYNRKVSIL